MCSGACSAFNLIGNAERFPPGDFMKITLAFDVYGTLVDPCGMAAHLVAECQDTAEQFAEFWREKQLEYEVSTGFDAELCRFRGMHTSRPGLHL